MNDQRPTRWPCSADSSRNAGPAPRSFRNAETGRLAVLDEGLRRPGRGCARRLPRATRARAELLSDGGNEHLLGVGEAEAARAQQHGQVVEDVGGLLGDALVGLLARGAGDLLGLLLDLLADQRRVGQQLGGVGALGRLRRARGDRALEAGQRLVRRRRLELAVVEARALAGVAGRAGGLDEREHGVDVAVEAQRLDRLRVARRRALVPQLVARAAPEVQLAGLARARERLGVHVGERQHLAVASPGSRTARGRARRRRWRRPSEQRDSRRRRRRSDRIGRRSRRLASQVPGEGAPARPLAAHDGQQRGQRARRQRRDQRAAARSAQRGTRGAWRAGERAVARRAPARGALAGEHRAQLAAARRCRSRTRCGSPRPTAGSSGRRCRRRRTRRPRPPGAAGAGTSCPGSGRRRRRAGARSSRGRLLDVVARLVGADADALLAGRGHRPRVAVADERAVDPDVEVGAAAVRVDLEAARDRAPRAAGRWRPGPSTRRQPSASTISGARQVAAVGVDRVAARGRSTFAISKRASALLPQLLRTARGSRSSTSSTAAGSAPTRAACGSAMHASSWRIARSTPIACSHGVGAAQARRRALADLVAVDHEHVGAAAGQLARDREPGEARAADQHVGARRRSGVRSAPRSVARRVIAAAPQRDAPGSCQARHAARGGRARRSRPPRRGRACRR